MNRPRGKQSTAGLKDQVVQLLGNALPRLGAKGNPDTIRLTPWVQSGSRRAKLEPRPAWLVESRRLDDIRERGDRTEQYQETWLDVDAAIYVCEPSIVHFNPEPFCTMMDVDDLDPGSLELVVALIHRLLNIAFPPGAPTKTIDCLGATFEVRAGDATSALGAPSGARTNLTVMGQAGSEEWPPTRANQIRYLFLSWLWLLRIIRNNNNDPFGLGRDLGWDLAVSRPEMFLAGAVPQFWLPTAIRDRFPQDFPQPVLPAPAAPYVPDAPVSADEVLIVVQDLVDAGLAAWRPSELLSTWRDEQTPIWVFVLTEQGASCTEELRIRFRDKDRARLLRIALMKWIGAHVHSEERVQPLYLCQFLGSPISVIDGVAAAVPDANEAMSWLTAAGFVVGSASEKAMPGSPVGTLTKRGYACVESHGGDPMTTPLYGTPGPDQRVYISSSQIGNIATHSSGVVQEAGDIGATTSDFEALVRFVKAVSDGLPGLELAPQQQRAAAALAAEIILVANQGKPDHPKLRVMGRTLRAIVEGAGSSVLAAGILSLWGG